MITVAFLHGWVHAIFAASLSAKVLAGPRLILKHTFLIVPDTLPVCVAALPYIYNLNMANKRARIIS